MDAQDDPMSAVQATQLASQIDDLPSVDSHLWGYLAPCSSALVQFDFLLQEPTYTVGRGEGSYCRLAGFSVSQEHCEIAWNGIRGLHSTVTVRDKSSNGTYINGIRIRPGENAILKDGQEICFGTINQQVVAAENYRYIYRHLAKSHEIPVGVDEAYDIAHELGRGAFAIVMKAVHRASGDWYAVKRIRIDQSLSANSTRLRGTSDASSGGLSSPGVNYAREISVMEALNHKNICKLKESFWGTTTIDLVLEYIDGGDLLNTIIANAGLDERMTQYLTYQICDAMQYLHSKGIAHRDLKPDNIMLTSQNPPVVKIADFGLAKAANNLIKLNTMCGTPEYLAPEVVLGGGVEYDHLVDSWSVGAIVFSMLTASAPFVDDSKASPKDNIQLRDILWLELEQTLLCQAGYDFIGALMHFDPKCRMSLAEAWTHKWLFPFCPLPTEDEDDSDMVTESSAGLPTSAAAPGNTEGFGETDTRGHMLRYYVEACRHPTMRTCRLDALPRPPLDLVPMAGASQPPRSKGPAKRLRPQFSDVEFNGGVLPDESVRNVARKKGKAAVREGKRPMGSPATPLARNGRIEEDMDISPTLATGPRRSPRNAGKPQVKE